MGWENVRAHLATQRVYFCPFQSRSFYYTTLLKVGGRGSKDGSVDTRVEILERIIKLKALCAYSNMMIRKRF